MNKPTAYNYNPFAGPELNSVLPLTDAQKEIWISSRVSREASLAYNQSIIIHFVEQINVVILQNAINSLIKMHDSLRARISPNGSFLEILKFLDIPVQVFKNSGSFDWDQIIDHEMDSEFDLLTGPLFRTSLYLCGQNKQSLIISAHHIICDGWSLDTLLSDLSSIYSSILYVKDTITTKHQFGDYVIYLQNQADQIRKSEEYWKNIFYNDTPCLDLPLDNKRPAVRTYNAGCCNFVICAKLAANIKSIAAKTNSSLFVALLTAWAVHLYRLTNQKEIVIGVPFAGQPDAGMVDVTGHCVTLLPILFKIDGQKSYIDQVKNTKKLLLDAGEYRQLSFGTLLQKLKVKRDPSRIPLVSVCFTHTQKFGNDRIKFGTSTIEYRLLPRNAETFELHLNAIESVNGIELFCQYNKSLFNAETITRRLDGFKTLLSDITQIPNTSLDRLNIISKDESDQIEKWAGSINEWPIDDTLIGMLDTALKDAPESIALIDGSRELTFKNLHQKANYVARQLMERGVVPDTPVGILTERSAEMVIAILATIKAGGAYVPLEPTLPLERLEFMINDTKMPVILTQSKFMNFIPEFTGKINIDNTEGIENPPSNSLKSNNLAYIIYTSGSTGEPKGAANTHMGICNRLQWMKELVNTGKDACFLQKTPFGFDVSVWEFFLPLITGTKLVLAKPKGHQDPEYLISLINKHNITCIHFVPSMLNIFLTNRNVMHCKSLLQVICSGEALTAALRDKFHSIFSTGPDLYNFYGPTEAAVDVTVWQCNRHDIRQTVPIGKPVPNTTIHILDNYKQPVPIGVYGELYIGGVQVAREYVNRPSLNREKFLPDPFAKQNTQFCKLFRTGDIGRWLPDSSIDFLGRADFQVKIRGMRIELGEIEYAIRNHPDIADAAVIISDLGSDDKRIIAYIVTGKSLQPDLKSYLSQKLPDYMIPSKITEVKFLPINANGKLDRNALSLPDFISSKESQNKSCIPQSELENKLSEMWGDLLKISKYSMDDNFFDLGGHSLLLAEMQGRIDKELDSKLSITDLFSNPTIRLLSKFLSGIKDQSDNLIRIRERAHKQHFAVQNLDR